MARLLKLREAQRLAHVQRVGDLKVQVRPCGEACVARIADDLPLADRLPQLNLYALVAQVVIDAEGAIAVIDADEVALRAAGDITAALVGVFFEADDEAGLGGGDGRALGDIEV